jgi:hypothetical protein
VLVLEQALLWPPGTKMLRKICQVEVEEFLKPASFLEMIRISWKVGIATNSVLGRSRVRVLTNYSPLLNTTPNPPAAQPPARNHANARLSLRRFAVEGARFGVFFDSHIPISDTENCLSMLAIGHAIPFGHPAHLPILSRQLNCMFASRAARRGH